MDNFEKELKDALKELLGQLQSKSQLKNLKTFSLCFVFGNSGMKLSKDAKKEVIKLIKSDSVTIFGGLYSEFGKSERELIDDHLGNSSLFSYITIGLPEEK